MRRLLCQLRLEALACIVSEHGFFESYRCIACAHAHRNSPRKNPLSMALNDEDKFVELNRTFHELRAVGKGDDSDVLGRFFATSSLNWDKLVLQYRVVVLSEAGSGKTQEIRNTTRRLRAENRAAFFLRLEHVVSDFEEAFEEGTFLEFTQWLQSGDEGWLLLDSIDEARLRSPSDLERALRKISSRTRPAMQRAHIIITGRTTAWRPKTDLALFKNQFPFSAPLREPAEATMSDDPDVVIVEEKSWEKNRPPFLIVALDELTSDQIRRFAEGKGVADVSGLLDAIERADAHTFTARPQDLSEVVGFWEDHRRIGTRLELMRNSIKRRLTERDQNRAEARPMDATRVRMGSVLVAGAATMAQEQAVRVPDGAENREGLPVTSILPDWDEQDCSTLLNRPIFDEAIYGSVRFHHRSVREYLAAEWLGGLLAQESSRRTIEDLLFREQYGIEVIIPTMRPILPWLILLDPGIRDRALRLAPELVFEGGDPAQLPLEMQRKLLEEICARLATDKTYRTNSDISAVQRFANPGLADDINALLATHGSDEDASWLLLRMIWQGQLKHCLPGAMQFALNRRTSKYTRIAAFRAVAAVGSGASLAQVRSTLLSERGVLRREWLAELLNETSPTTEAVNWLLRALAKTPPPEEFSSDGLSEAVWQFVEKANADCLVLLSEGMGRLLKRGPLIERQFRKISQRYHWLAKPAALAVQRLIEQRHPAALSPSSLDVLRRFGIGDDHSGFDLRGISLRLAELVRTWPALNEALFWFDVASARKALDKAKRERLDDWWRVSLGPSLWAWSMDDIERLLGFVNAKRFLDDRLIALSLVFHLYQTNSRPAALRRKLWRTAKGTPEVESRLATLMRPSPQNAQMKAWKRNERRWKQRSAARENKRAKNNEDWRVYLRENIDRLRDPRLAKPEHVSNAQHYLHYQLERQSNTHWQGCDWRSLIPKHGSEVAEAFRDGCVAYWRRNRPKLRSEGAPSNTTYFSTIFGLSGIGIEADETPNWPSELTEEDAELATRYALFELNGYPDWMQRLYTAFPDAVCRILLKEVRWELGNATPKGEMLYALHDVGWYGEWMWDRWAPILITELTKREPITAKSLPQMLKVLHGSSLPDEKIRDLAEAKCGSVNDRDHLTHWYAAWVGVDPARAIPKLEEVLDSMPDNSGRLDFAMKFVTNLLGGRRSDYPAARSAYRTVPHLKALYLLMHKHIRQRDDIERANTGAYSPGLRDNAQDARDQLFNLLNEIPGKEAFLALMDISRAHPEPNSRPWFMRHARKKAEQDVESGSWSLEQFVDFNIHLERTPANNAQLFALVWLRLLDLKDQLEQGDSSIASILKTVTSETEVRKYIGDELRKGSGNRFAVPQEEELADATKPDIRIHGHGFDGPVPLELKLADNWTGPHLFERMETQLCGDYLRDPRSKRGLFVLVYRGEKAKWRLPNSKNRVGFDSLVQVLQKHWGVISPRFSNIVDLHVLGIDLTKREQKQTARSP